MKKLINLISLLGLLFLSGCASIVSTSNYPVEIKTDPAGADVSVYKDSVLMYTGVTPTIVALKSSNGYFSGADYTIKLSKKGYQSENRDLRSTVCGWYFVNILFGLFGGPIGLVIVDPLTGAMWNLPNSIYSNLEPVQ